MTLWYSLVSLQVSRRQWRVGSSMFRVSLPAEAVWIERVGDWSVKAVKTRAGTTGQLSRPQVRGEGRVGCYRAEAPADSLGRAQVYP